MASTVGTRASSVAFPLLVLALTGSPSQAALVAFAQTLPFPLIFLVAGIGVGAIRGALVAPAVARHVPARYVIVGTLWLWVVYPLVLVALPNALAIGVVAGFASIFGPIFNVVLSAYRYALVPDRLLGRVGSVILLVAWGTIPLGAISAGFLLEPFGAVTSMLVLAGVSFAVAAGTTLTRTVRDVPAADELRARATLGAEARPVESS